MGTSFVKYKGFGFWTRDSFLQSWLTTLLNELRKSSPLELWQKSLVEHWSVQATVDGGVISVGLDDFLADQKKEEFLLSVAKQALERSEPLGRRTGELFIQLLDGRLKTIVSSPIDYLNDQTSRSP